ncbi:MAG: fumarylacetoacetate hydrolase family protein [Solirubrobacterales bacterium]|nr:fumarylacetoacetate hydrolase family protein [Solirubrobacterales bacterium]
MSVESAGLRLVRVSDPDGNARVGVVAGDELGLLGHDDMIGTLERGEVDSVLDSVPIRDAETLALPEPWRVLVPIVAPETWAAGVTYERSREARTAESQRRDVYDLVYDAERPELFLKDAAGRRTVGPGEPIAVRSDASWSVPEPELAVVLGAGARPLAVTIGNDVSSRDIEGANPLYLPQAKIYGRACALGPALLVPLDWSVSYEIELRIFDASGQLRFEDGTSTASMCRSISTLTEFLRRDNPVPAGSVLLTGTGIVPPDEMSLTPGQTVEIRISGIGVLRSPVGGAAHLNEPKEDQANV